MRGTHKPLAFFILTAVLAVAAPAGPARAATRFVAPVDAEVSRRFSLPNGEFGAGHRGIDYRVPEGTAVRAAAAGVVEFAGNTPEGLYVTIRHDGDIRTTYSLGQLAVAEGQQVGQSSMIGRSGHGHGGGNPLLHFGARVGGKYVDPLLLLGDFDDITDLINLAQLQGTRAPHAALMQPTAEVPGVGAGPAVAPFVPDGTAGFVPFVPDTSPGVPPFRPDTSPDLGPRPQRPSIPTPGARSGPPIQRGPPLPSQFFRDDLGWEGGIADAQFDPRSGLPRFKDPKLVGQWWQGLTENEREKLIDRHPREVGHLVGVPIDARDRANRLALSRRIKELESRQRQRDRDLAWFPEARLLLDHRTVMSKFAPSFAKQYENYVGLTPWRRRMTALSRELAGAKHLQRELEAMSRDPRNLLDPSDVNLMELDTTAGFGDGQAVVALADPSTAEHIGVVVPGINNTLLNVENPLEDAAVLRARVAAQEGTDVMDRTSTIMWLGYDAPNSLLDAGNDVEAREGSPRLTKFIDGLRAAHARASIRRGYSERANRDPHISGFAHSYGSVVAGMATASGMDIDDLAALGSPGGGALYGTQLASIHRGIWAARSSDDPIRWVPPVHGQDPMDPEFNAASIGLDADQEGHGEYFELDSLGLINMAWILTGRYEMIRSETDD